MTSKRFPVSSFDGLKLLLIFTLYFITGRVGLQIDAVSGFATLIWAPTAIALCATLFYGYRALIAVFIGAFLVNFLQGAHFAAALGIASGNTLEAFTAAFILKNIVKLNFSLEKISDVFGLTILAAPVSAAISATVGTASIFFSGVVNFPDFGQTWLTWFTGNILSNLVITPFILVWRSNFHIEKRDFRRILEITALMTFTIGLSYFVFTNRIPITYTLFIPLIYIALRFGQRETITSVLLISAIAVWQTIHGNGPFGYPGLHNNLFYLQTFTAVVSISSMVLAAVVSERRELEKRKDDFINMASHEFKTPITSIKIFSWNLQRAITEKQMKKSQHILHRIDDQIGKLSNLTEALLNLSRMQKGKMQFAYESFSLGELIRNCINDVQSTSTAHIITLQGTLDKNVYADKNRVEQVVLNLLLNAVKYSPPHTKIAVTMKQGEKFVTVSVKDQGIGIDKKHLEKIFERFYRIQDGKLESYPGFGLGLYIASQIIQGQKGRLWVESTPGKGSKFYFSLPLST